MVLACSVAQKPRYKINYKLTPSNNKIVSKYSKIDTLECKTTYQLASNRTK